MTRRILLLAAIVSALTLNGAEPLKAAFKDKFLIGMAMTQDQIHGKDPKGVEIIKTNSSVIVPENAMKMGVVNPKKGVWNWTHADKFMQFAEENGLPVRVHCLIWHQHYDKLWFPKDDNGNLLGKEAMKQRMRDYIHTVMGRYKGRVAYWEVVNEAIMEDGSYRDCSLYRVLGEDYIPLAFKYAREADPGAKLYINDYSMYLPAKREAYKKLIKKLKAQGLIDAVGVQSHYDINFNDFDNVEKTIEDYARLGVEVMITELDMTTLKTWLKGDNIERDPLFNPYPHGLNSVIARNWNSRMERLMDIYLRHAKDISMVTFWGVTDGDSWYNYTPKPGRRDYPLAFDRSGRIKPFLTNVMRKMRMGRYH